MKKTKYLIIGILALIVLLLLIFLQYRFFQSTLAGRTHKTELPNNQIVNQLNNQVPSNLPTEDSRDTGVEPLDSSVLLASDQSAFEAYLRQNIKTLSPEPAVLGGTFYLTSIIWSSDGSALIEYEDGHIALKARVVLVYTDAAKTSIEVRSFDIIK